MKKAIFIFILISPFLVFAHQPKLVSDGPTEVGSPEVSKAYYGELDGVPEYYLFESKKPFLLYVNVLVPAMEGIEKDISAMIFKKEEGYLSQLAFLDGQDFNWQPYHEPFGGDDYFQGPEEEREVSAGAYLIQVSSPDNQGKYVLAVGQQERFSPKDIFETLITLPKLKSQFFGKPSWTAYFNYTGLMVLLFLAVLAILFFVLKFWLPRIQKRFKERGKGPSA